MAHRGGATYPPNLGVENSSAAFARAVELGYRWLETDVHASSDGVLFAFHDTTLTRLTGQDGSIADLHSTRLASARIGGTEPVPTLESLLVDLPDACFNIDVKDERAVQPLIDLLGRLDAWGRVCLASFEQRRVWRLRRLAPAGTATSAGRLEVAALRAHSGMAALLGGPRCDTSTDDHRVGHRRLRPGTGALRGVPLLTPNFCTPVTPGGWQCTHGRWTSQPRCTACSTSAWTG
jgi:glycerophosphoryl diester phosphodiesterase